MKRHSIQGSTNIASVGHEESTHTLEVEFIGKNGRPNKVYQYSPITREGYEALLKAESVGTYFAKHIKNDSRLTVQPIRSTIKRKKGK